MKIILDGKTTINKLPTILRDVVTDIKEKAGVPDAPVKIERAEIVFTAMINGEPQYFTVDHEGLKELFTVAVKLDEKGNIIKAVNNENESFLDEYTRAMAKGETKEYKVIESIFKDEELETVRVNDGGDIQEIIYRHKEKGDTVVRYFKNGDLVGEVAFETSPETVMKEK